MKPVNNDPAQESGATTTRAPRVALLPRIAQRTTTALGGDLVGGVIIMVAALIG